MRKIQDTWENNADRIFIEFDAKLNGFMFQGFKRWSWLLLGWGSGAGILSLLWGVSESALFKVKTIEIVAEQSEAPVGEDVLREIVKEHTEGRSIFKISADALHKILKENAWIESVETERLLPQTLKVAVKFRAPSGIVQDARGGLNYVDRSGAVFGPILGVPVTSLPVFIGFNSSSELQKGLQFVKNWSEMGLKNVKLSSISSNDEGGYRVIISYSIKNVTARSTVFFGSDLELKPQIASVFKYLTNHQLLVRQIYAELGKKIIVKRAIDS